MSRCLLARSPVPVLVAVTLLAASATARADRRAFTHTYEYQTMPQGGLDLEIWNAQTRPVLSGDATGQEFKLETEYGITDHWDIALYQILSQSPEPGAPLQYSATTLETRYRFAERGEWPIDTLAYMEVKKSLIGSDTELEWKAILAKDFGSLTLALNLIAELVFEDGTSFVPGWAFGATYEVVPSLKIGAETFGERSETSDLNAWVGPSISWAPPGKIWLAANTAFGLTSTSEDLIVQFIIGISL
jgi:hypothetical protein